MEKKSYHFSAIRYDELEQIVQIQLGDKKVNQEKFQEWFQFEYEMTDFEIQYFENLIDLHERDLTAYSEEKLKMRFLAPILNQVNFSGKIQDWYDISLKGTINGVEMKGFADFMVASGTKVPHEPYFFIHEFKPSVPDKDPETQLLAELLIAIEKNDKKLMRGGYIIGQNWRFVILEKQGENQFEYFVSRQLDSLSFEGLKQIYICLQAIKLKYCKF